MVTFEAGQPSILEVSITGGVVYKLTLDELTPYSGDLTDVAG
jgi:hypothetical protein